MTKNEREQAIIADYQSGIEVRDIVENHGTSRGMIYKTLDANDIPRKTGTVTPDQLKLAVRECINGETLRETVKTLGCSLSYLSSHVAKEKVRLNQDIFDTLGKHDTVSSKELSGGDIEDRVYMRTNGLITHLVIPVKELL